PTAMMGLTLPLLAAATSASSRAAGARVSWLYTVNTAGAIVGALAAGFALIPAIGIRGSFDLAAAINLLVGTSALWLSRLAPRATDGSESVERPAAWRGWSTRLSDRGAAAAWAVVVVSGFASLRLEVVWFRLLLQF